MFDIETPAVIFDLDGTLYDKTGLPLRMIMSQLCHLRLLRSERRARHSLMGRDFGDSSTFRDEYFRRLSDFAGVSADAAREWYIGNYMPAMVSVLASHFRMRPEMVAQIAALKRKGVRIAVFSDYDFAEQKLRAIGFDPSDADAGVYDAPSLGGLKPSAESFRRVAAAMGFPPSEITVIGDRDDTDAEGARRCGMKYFLI